MWNKKKWPYMPTVHLELEQFDDNMRVTTFVAKWKQQAKKDKWNGRRIKQVLKREPGETLWNIVPMLVDYCE